MNACVSKCLGQWFKSFSACSFDTLRLLISNLRLCDSKNSFSAKVESKCYFDATFDQNK